MTTIDRRQFAQHPDMPALMGMAHNKPSGRRRPPCLTRHQTLWMPETLENALLKPKAASDTGPPVLATLADSTFSPAEEERDAWVLKLEQFILNIYDKLKMDHPNHSDVPPLSLSNFLQKEEEDTLSLLQNVYTYNKTTKKYGFAKTISGTIHHNTVCIKGIWHSMPVEIIVELRTEYVTISTTIDLGHRRVPGLYEHCEQFYYKHVHQALTDFDDVMARRYGELKDHEVPISKEDSNKLTTAYSTLYHTIGDRKSVWVTCRDDLFGSAIEKVGADNLGRLIGDIRGLLLRHRNDNPKHFITLHHPEEDNLEPSTPSLLNIIDGHPFGGGKGDDKAKRKANRMDDIIQIVDTLKPFMLADPYMAATATGTTRENPTELSFTTFFDECGIHASAVSLQNPAPNVRINPLPCLSLMTRHEGWEMGRLVDIGNRLNTLRLAALYSYSNMIIANRLLHEVEQDLNELSRDLLGRLEKPHGNTTVKDQLLNFSKRIAEIAYTVPGGLAYRGERSNYYRTQFTAFAELLRFGEIVGHQPFEEMVERRLGSAYGLISQTHQRLDRITKSMKEIEEDAQTDREVKALELTVRQTEAALKIQTQIGKQTTATTDLLGETVKQTKVAVDLQAKIGAQTTATTKLLRAAEFGFWAVLFPYYSSTFLLHNVFGDKGIEAVNKWIDGILSYPIDKECCYIHFHDDYNLVKIYISLALLAYGVQRALRAIHMSVDETNNNVNSSGYYSAERPLDQTVAR